MSERPGEAGTLENRPVDLIIHGPKDPATGRSTAVRRIELDS